MSQLAYHREIITELLAEDGLLILGRGLGLRRIQSTILRIYDEPQNLVIILNLQADEEEALQEDMESEAHERVAPGLGLRRIEYETPAEQRNEIYRAGGVMSVTSRILAVDMLLKRIPIHLITGILVMNAHRVSETSMEAFILRLYREGNTEGFIKAFSDAPESFVTGFAPLQNTLKNLMLRKVHLWPRFHLTVSHTLEVYKADVIELRQPLSDNMESIQHAIIECMDACLSELRRSCPTVDVEEFTVENALFKSFDAIIRQQLDPIWHRVGFKTKQLVGDLKTLRRLLSYLVEYDCVTFNSFIETVLASSGSAESQSRNQQSPWLFMEAADTLFTTSKDRVYRGVAKVESETPNTYKDFPPSIVPVLEEQPKWGLLHDVLDEIQADIHGDSLGRNHENTVVILVEDERTCLQLREYLSTMHLGKGLGGSGGQPMLRRLLKNYFRWKTGIAKVKQNIFEKDKQSNGQGSTPPQEGQRPHRGPGVPPPNKRRRVRGGSAAAAAGLHSTRRNMDELDQEARELASFLNANGISNESNGVNGEESKDAAAEEQYAYDEQEFSQQFSVLPASSLIIVRPYQGDKDDGFLEQVRPRFIIMYDPDPAFIRRVEVYRVLYPEIPVRVYFMVYNNSVEEQRYLSNVRKEKEAFEKLIRERSIMAIPFTEPNRRKPEDLFLKTLNTRIAGGGRIQNAGPPKVIVDMREFRSSLPPILHAQGMEIVPCTLQVADYILSPTMCVERKSISDLIGSFNSGRLYTQCVTMSAYYKDNILLIEFDQHKSFSLQSLSDMKADITMTDLSSKLVLLSLSFPKLRYIWSSSPYATAEIFEDLKASQEEPDPDKAVLVGLQDAEDIDSTFNLTPQDILRSIPGITFQNYRLIMNKVESLRELADMSLEDMGAIIGHENARRWVPESAKAAQVNVAHHTSPKPGVLPYELPARGCFMRLFYPIADTGRKRERAYWLPSTRYGTAMGEFGGIKPWVIWPLAATASTYKSQAWLDAEPHPDIQKFPVMIFSHGLGGNRVIYTAFCTEMASHGFIVCAIEHRDGSASCAKAVGCENLVMYVPPPTTKWGDPSTTAFRIQQLRYRLSEVDQCIQFLRYLNTSNNTIQDSLVEHWVGKLDLENIVVSGHSFGGATALETLRIPDAPISCGVLLDTWCGALIYPEEPNPILHPFIAINSEQFTDWSSNFNDLQKLLDVPSVRDRSILMHIEGSRHQSQADILVLFWGFVKYVKSVGGTIDPVLALDLNNRAIIEFIRRISTARQAPSLEYFDLKEDDAILSVDVQIRPPQVRLH
ncbi:hypothetical protein BZG36_03031 [Bifiguratus adelaidae]|uniref:ERCC4 domain-containing protein n=1 Tax=Bifiguratus adelaidae TaxID=1938954 RepID=A0A261XZ07_9FUNG|nr:hypothetical protein BZG36_03031 [Bifiguratus adelaidae]